MTVNSQFYYINQKVKWTGLCHIHEILKPSLNKTILAQQSSEVKVRVLFFLQVCAESINILYKTICTFLFMVVFILFS